MLTYSAHLPHSPALLPHLYGKKSSECRKSRAAIAEIAGDLYGRKIETVVFITPHGPGDHHYFTLNFSPHYRVDFSKFGDLASRDEFNGDSELTLQASEQLRPAQPLKIITREKLDTASSTAILQLAKPRPPVAKKGHKDADWPAIKHLPPLAYKIMPITYALLPADELIAFGKAWREIVEENNKRIAVISLGDLAHGKNKTAEAGQLDKTIIKNLKGNDLRALSALAQKQIGKFSVAGWRALLIMSGVLSDIHYKVEVLSYEQKFGVGLMTARFLF